jgi:FKBP-type peptidyl-prolyl cis-trans isomerase SlyD
MQIAKDKVVTIDYTLTDGQGTLLDSSQDGEPLSYIQGAGSIIPGLEAALEGKSTGEASRSRLRLTRPTVSGMNH